MTNTTVEEREPMLHRRATDRVYDRDHEPHRDEESVRVKETRRSLLTTEFWITVASAVGLIIAGYWGEADLSLNLAYALAAGIVAAYILSRGFAKSGSTPFSRTVH